MSNVVEEDIKEILSCPLPWHLLSGKVVAITGATGMLAAYLVETLLSLNTKLSDPIKVVALVRNKYKAAERFSRWVDEGHLFIKEWMSNAVDLDIPDCNIMIHAASISRPDIRIPVDVIEPNVIGTWNLLRYCEKCCNNFESFIFFSSRAVYGDDNSQSDMSVNETQFFPIDQMNPKSCYAEAKRMGENMCVSFMRQYNLPVKILRYAHTYGPGMDLKNDPRSFVSFVNKAIHGEDIELATSGEQTRCFCYIADATKAFFYVLLRGRVGEAYNIANDNGESSIFELASLIAQLGGVKAQRNLCQLSESGYAPQRFVKKPDTTKLKKLGFQAEISIKDGFSRVMRYYGGLRNRHVDFALSTST